MQRSVAVIVKGLGWLLVLCVPYVLLGSLFAPRIVQVLNRPVCGTVGHLDNRAITDTGTRSSSIELVCRGGRNDNVTARIVALLVALVVISFVCFYVANRLRHPKTRVVTVESRR
jgi:hypothetical protein